MGMLCPKHATCQSTNQTHETIGEAHRTTASDRQAKWHSNAGSQEFLAKSAHHMTRHHCTEKTDDSAEQHTSLEAADMAAVSDGDDASEHQSSSHGKNDKTYCDNVHRCSSASAPHELISARLTPKVLCNIREWSWPVWPAWHSRESDDRECQITRHWFHLAWRRPLFLL